MKIQLTVFLLVAASLTAGVSLKPIATGPLASFGNFVVQHQAPLKSQDVVALDLGLDNQDFRLGASWDQKHGRELDQLIAKELRGVAGSERKFPERPAAEALEARKLLDRNWQQAARKLLHAGLGINNANIRQMWRLFSQNTFQSTRGTAVAIFAKVMKANKAHHKKN